jgi:hypothetical protein
VAQKAALSVHDGLKARGTLPARRKRLHTVNWSTSLLSLDNAQVQALPPSCRSASAPRLSQRIHPISQIPHTSTSRKEILHRNWRRTVDPRKLSLHTTMLANLRKGMMSFTHRTKLHIQMTVTQLER